MGDIYVAVRLSQLDKEVQLSVVPDVTLGKLFFSNVNLANFSVGYWILCITIVIEFDYM